MGIRLSHTANNRYKDSPRSWYLHYILNIRPEKYGSALMFGSAMDLALNTMLENKQKNENKDYIEVFERAMKSQEYNGKKIKLATSDKVKYWKSDLDESIWTDEDCRMAITMAPEWVTLRRKGLMMLDAYKEQVLPHLSEIISVQDYVRIDNENGDYIVGWIDFVAKFEPDVTSYNYNSEWEKWRGKVIIWDNKTTSQKYKDESVSESPQLGTYFENPTDKYVADACGYIAIPKKFRKNKMPLIPIQIIIDDVSPEVILQTFNSYQETLEGIKLGIFPCTGECKKTPWGCDYQKYCDSNGKDMTGLVRVPKKREE